MNMKKYNLSEEEIKTERKSVLKTVILSLLFPLIFWIMTILLESLHISICIELSMLIFIILNVVIYYCIIMRKRKNDVFIDSNNRRIRISLIIQIAVYLIFAIVVLCCTLASDKSPEDSYIGNRGNVLIALYSLIIPVIVHIVGVIFFIAEKAVNSLERQFKRN